MATPDNYPLTMNALLAACNQTTNRFPVTKLDEPTVSNALQNLRAMNIVRIVYSRSNRADKYRHVLDEILALEPEHLALLAVLMLRGPQTTSELRARAERLHPFTSQEEVDDALHQLARRDEPLVARLERRSGQKENRWAHLLGGDLAEAIGEADEEPEIATRPSARADRLAALEEEVAELRADLERLQAAHHDLVVRLGEDDG
ncbi:MAG: YceH family protein [Actinomycetota bacterium]|nr:YceH family protein [Actinomycetota bacterium]